MNDISEMTLDELYFIILLHDDIGKDIPYDMDEVWNNVAKYYYTCKQVYEDNRDILFAWIKEKARYPLLDILMLQVYDKFVNDNSDLNKTDPFFISNTNEMYNIMTSYGKGIHKENRNEPLSKMNHSEVIQLVKEILIEIDPTLDWLNIYEEAATEKRIVYIDLLDGKDRVLLQELFGFDLSSGDINSCIFLKNKNEGHILLTYTGTISDVVTTIHEVIHYISRSQNNWQEECPILREFPSIFYEMYVLDYLKKMGYDEKELKMIEQVRIEDMEKFYDRCESLMEYLIMLIEYGEISSKYDNDYKKADKCIKALVHNPYLLNDYYPYLIGHYLAYNGFKNSQNDKVMFSIVKYMTDHLIDMDAYDVFNVLGCGDANFIRKDEELFKYVKTLKK